MDGFLHFNGLTILCLVVVIVVIYSLVQWHKRIKVGDWVRIRPGGWKGTKSPLEYGRLYQVTTTVRRLGQRMICLDGLFGSFEVRFFTKDKTGGSRG